MKRFSLAGVAMTAMAVMVLAAAGCASNPEPGVTARFGTIHAQVPGQPQRIVRAARAALKKMDLILISANASQFDGKVVARTSDDKAVDVTVKNKNNRASDVTIDVASDNAKSMGLTVLHNIQDQLRQSQGRQARNEQNPNNPQNPNFNQNENMNQNQNQNPNGSAGRSARLPQNNNQP